MRRIGGYLPEHTWATPDVSAWVTRRTPAGTPIRTGERPGMVSVPRLRPRREKQPRTPRSSRRVPSPEPSEPTPAWADTSSGASPYRSPTRTSLTYLSSLRSSGAQDRPGEPARDEVEPWPNAGASSMATTRLEPVPAANENATAAHPAESGEQPSGSRLEPQRNGETDTAASGVARRTA
jgi:hypothetical protein